MTHLMAPDGVPIMPALFVGHGSPMNTKFITDKKFNGTDADELFEQLSAELGLP